MRSKQPELSPLVRTFEKPDLDRIVGCDLIVGVVVGFFEQKPGSRQQAMTIL